MSPAGMNSLCGLILKGLKGNHLWRLLSCVIKSFNPTGSMENSETLLFVTLTLNFNITAPYERKS